jgi:threonine dehydratase
MSGAAGDPLSRERIAAAQRASSATVRRTPLLTAGSLSDRCGGTILLKAENLQRTGSFKLRGALNKVRQLDERCAGVVAGSAGNHAQSLAYAARAHGLRCEIFMPEGAAVSKVAAVRDFGAIVREQGTSVDQCVALARARADESDLVFVHPFDDEQIVAGQAGVGVELAEDAAEVATVIVPVGGGGLAAGIAVALAQRRPQTRVVGVQAAVCAPYPASLQAGRPLEQGSTATIADGIAIKRPGGLTLPLIERYVDEVVTVGEDAIAEAMVLLVERAKLVVEGAGAVAVAALLAGVVRPAQHGQTVAVLSGGNVDIALLAALGARHETNAGRRIRLLTKISDQPGGLADLLGVIAAGGVNVLGVEHVRDGVSLDVRQTGVELSLETRGDEHARALLDDLHGRGYELSELPV